MTTIVQTSDGGYLVGGYFHSESVNLENEISFINRSGYVTGMLGSDGIIIKYNSKFEIEWAHGMGGSSDDEITMVAECDDGSYIAVGSFKSYSIYVDDNTQLSLGMKSYGVIIKFNQNGMIEYTGRLGEGENYNLIEPNCVISSKDGYIIGANIKGNFTLNDGTEIKPNSTSTTVGIIIKYNSENNVEWYKLIEGSNVELISISQNENEEIVVGGSCQRIKIKDVYSEETTGKNGFIIKYDINRNEEWGKVIGNEKSNNIQAVKILQDSSVIAVGDFQSSKIDLKNGDSLNNNGATDGMVIKYSINGTEEWSHVIGGTLNDYIRTVETCSDGGYIIGGDYRSSLIEIGNGNVLKNSSNGHYSEGMIIKYNSSGEIEYFYLLADTICSMIENDEGDYVIGGNYSGNLTLENGIKLPYAESDRLYDGMVVKFKEVDVLEPIINKKKVLDGYSLYSATETSDGGYVVGGSFQSEVINPESQTSCVSKGGVDGIIIKYDKNNKLEWEKCVGSSKNDSIRKVSSSTDQGFFVTGYYNGEIDLGDGIILKATTKNTSISGSGMIIKYNDSGYVEWAKGIGNFSTESIVGSTDGGCFVSGYFSYDFINFGNGITLQNTNSSFPIENDGCIAKYDKNGNCEWAKKIGGIKDDRIESINNTSDGGCIVGGCYYSPEINLENETLTNSNPSSTSSENVMLIKYDKNGNCEWAKSFKGDTICEILQTQKGEYLVGGWFYANKSWNSYSISKFDDNGNIKWTRSIGSVGSPNSASFSIKETSDGKYMVLGSLMNDSNSLGLITKGDYDVVLFQLDEEGDIEYAKSLGGEQYDYDG